MISQKEVIALHFSPLFSMTETIARGERSDPMCLTKTGVSPQKPYTRREYVAPYLAEQSWLINIVRKISFLNACFARSNCINSTTYFFLTAHRTSLIRPTACSMEKSYGIVNFSVSFRQEMEGRLCQRHRYRVGNCTIPLCESDGESALYLSQFFHATAVHHISRPYFA